MMQERVSKALNSGLICMTSTPLPKRKPLDNQKCSIQYQKFCKHLEKRLNFPEPVNQDFSILISQHLRDRCRLSEKHLDRFNKLEIEEFDLKCTISTKIRKILDSSCKIVANVTKNVFIAQKFKKVGRINNQIKKLLLNNRMLIYNIYNNPDLDLAMIPKVIYKISYGGLEQHALTV
ncbi:hypothetical protein HUJ05_003710 [Dendroctonus ponderosae]|nr:hypothetical protein HUJ05_003710 [Dendroctonus ponderosae]